MDEPIICPDLATECVVVVNISNSHPEYVKVEPCYVRWQADEWHHTKQVVVSAVRGYRKSTDKEHKVHLETHVVSQAEYYNGFDPDDLYVKSKVTKTAGCSAVGDPHYTGFDGGYYHYYDGDGTKTITYYAAPERDFWIQTKVRGRPAANCGAAGREGMDRVVVDNCGGGLKLITDFNSPNKKDWPTVRQSGSTYTVRFKSGAWFRIILSSWYGNMYALSVDPGRSCGICGNFDGNAQNDYFGHGRGYTWQHYSSLPARCVDPDKCKPLSCTRIGPEGNIWNWKYDPNNFLAADKVKVPPAKKTCPYEPETKVLVIGNQDSEDITDFLKQRTDEIKKRSNFTFSFSSGGEVTQLQVDPFDATCVMMDGGVQPSKDKCPKSYGACKKRIEESPTATVCRAKYDEFDAEMANFENECMLDYNEFGGSNTDAGVEYLEGFVRILEQKCLELAIAYGDENEADLKAVLCQNACSGHGSCSNAACICEDTYAGNDCSARTNKPPELDTISEVTCDATGLLADECPRDIQITGSNFYKGNNKCRFGTTVVDAIFLGPRAILCPVPRIRHKGTDAMKLDFAVSNDGTQWSTEMFFFTYYDSRCHVCNRHTGTCSQNLDSCQLDGQCFLPSQRDPSDFDNSCRRCMPKTSSTSFSFYYAEDACHPKFDQAIYDAFIVAKAEKDDVIIPAGDINGRANSAVNEDPDYKIKYSLELAGPKQDNSADEWFNIDENTGEISMKKGVDLADPAFMGLKHAADNPENFEGFFFIIAEDQKGNTGKATVIIEIVPVGSKPIFPKGGFKGSVQENAPTGATIYSSEKICEVYSEEAPFDCTSWCTPNDAKDNCPLKIHANDPDATGADEKFKEAFASVTYSMFLEFGGAEGALKVDKDTGAVTVADGSKLDYERTDAQGEMTFQVKAEDASGMFHITEIHLVVRDAPEPPTNILLTGDQCVISDSGEMVYQILETPTGEDPQVQTIGKLKTVDPDAASTAFTYTLFDPSGKFSIVDEELRTSEAFDFEGAGPKTYDVTIKTQDEVGLSFQKVFTLTVTNQNEPPRDVRLSARADGKLADIIVANPEVTFPENLENGDRLANILANDDDAGQKYYCQIVRQDQPASLAIEENVLKVADEESLSFEKQPEITFDVACVDDDGLKSQSVSMKAKLLDRNGPPSDPLIKQTLKPLPETNPTADSRVKIGTISARDYDAESKGLPFTFKIAESDEDNFEFGERTCRYVTDKTPKHELCEVDLYLKKGGVASYEGNPGDPGRVPVRFTLIDGKDDKLESREYIRYIDVEDVQEPPKGIELSKSVVVERAPDGFTIATLTVLDEDLEASFEVELVDDANGAFKLAADDVAPGRRRDMVKSDSQVWKLQVNDWRKLTAGKHSFEVRVVGGGDQVTFSKDIEAVDALMTISPSEMESLDASTAVGEKATTLTLENMDKKQVAGFDWGAAWEIVDGNDADMFEVGSYFTGAQGTGTLRSDFQATAELLLKKAITDFDPYGTNNIKRVGVKVTLGNGISVESQISFRLVSGTPTFDESTPGRLKVVVPYGGEKGSAVLFNQNDVPTRIAGSFRPNQDEFANTDLDLQVKEVTPYDSKPSDPKGAIKYLGEGMLYDISIMSQDSDDFTDYTPPGNSLMYEQSFPDLKVADVKSTSGSGVLRINGEVQLANDISPGNTGYGRFERDVYIRLATDGGESRQARFYRVDVQYENACGERWDDTTKKLKRPTCPVDGEICTLCIIEGAGAADPTLADPVPCDIDDQKIGYVCAAPVILLGQQKEDTSSDTIGIVIGVIVLLIACAIGYLYYQKQQYKDTGFDTEFNNPAYGDIGAMKMADVDAFSNPMYGSTEQPFVPGQANPMYDWYAPSLGRGQANEQLMGQGEGAFLIRDLEANAGWHMLAVKSNNRVIQDKIRLNDDSTYELLPSIGDAANARQPQFAGLPDLVDFYTVERPGMAYTLQLSNPIYDNHALMQERKGYTEAVTTNYAPELAPKMGDGVSNPMYNTGTVVDPNYVDAAVARTGIVRRASFNSTYGGDPNYGAGAGGSYLDPNSMPGVNDGYLDIPAN